MTKKEKDEFSKLVKKMGEQELRILYATCNSRDMQDIILVELKSR